MFSAFLLVTDGGKNFNRPVEAFLLAAIRDETPDSARP